jgi:hypothetical protein
MESSNTNHEDKDNKGNINIPLETSALKRKMMEYIAAQTQVLTVNFRQPRVLVIHWFQL